MGDVQVRATPLLQAIGDVLVDRALSRLSVEDAVHFGRHLPEVLAALRSPLKPTRLHAPDAFIVRFVARLFEAYPVCWITRGRDTSGREARAVLVGRIGIIPIVWLVMCRNAPSSTLRTVNIEREVDWMTRTHATQALLFTTSRVPSDVRQAVDAVNATSATSLLLFGKAEMGRLDRAPHSGGRLLIREAQRALAVKVKRLESVLMHR